MRWSDGRSKGTTSLVKRSAIMKGTIAVGEKVMVAWGKTKRTFNAEIVDVNGGVRSRQNASNGEPFVFELAASASATQAMDLPSATPTPVLQDQQEDRIVAALVDKLDKLDVLVDAVSRVEALLCRLQTLEEEVTALKEEVRERCIHPQSSELQPNIIPEPEPQSLEEEPSPPVLQPCIPPAPYPSLEYPPLPPSLQPASQQLLYRLRRCQPQDQCLTGTPEKTAQTPRWPLLYCKTSLLGLIWLPPLSAATPFPTT